MKNLRRLIVIKCAKEDAKTYSCKLSADQQTEAILVVAGKILLNF